MAAGWEPSIQTEDLSRHKHVALKFHPDNTVQNLQTLERFQCEARVDATPSHCIIEVLGQI